MIRQTIYYGAITGLIMILYFGILYVAGIEVYSNWWLALLSLPVQLFLIIFFALKIRKQVFQGFWGFGDAFKTLLLLFAINGLVQMIWNLLLFNVIDTTLAERMTEIISEKTLTMMEDFGAPEDQIAQTAEELEKTPEQFSPTGLLLGFLKSLIWYGVISAIIALIIRKKTEEVSTLDR